MKIKGVITGDIVRSESIGLSNRDNLIQVLRKTVDDLGRHSTMKMEIYRGDSFQIVVDAPEKSLTIASMIRASLAFHTPEGEKYDWDARVSVGIGEIDYQGESIVVSDGEAFRLSGRSLDNMDKGRLSISTHWEDVNGMTNATIGFVDNILSSLKRNQAHLVYLSLAEQLPQTEIAAKTGKSQQNISKTLNTAKEPLLAKYFAYFEETINKHIGK